MLSIIIPAYNANDNLKKLLPLISDKNLYEVIIVDDHGLELAEEAVQQGLQSNVVVKRLESNLGAGAARNIGLELATRDYVAFFDADDMVNEPVLSAFLNSLPESKVYNDIYFFSPQSHKPDGSLGSRSNRYSHLVSSYIGNGDQAIRYKFHVPWSKIYRRDFVIEHSLSFDEVSASNDVMFSLKAGIKAKAIFVSKQSYYSVQEHNSGLTVNDSVSRLLDRLDVLIRYNQELSNAEQNKYRISIFPLLFRLFKQDARSFLSYLAAFEFSISRDLIPSSMAVKKALNIR
ncbi:glycosyltransferase [Vibrio alginolyticus]|uniref:glycosyltransferase family 2 protein n=1 Tax=Vibrio sp. B1FLJ16 TaxID=2751178 RepID=UPI0015F362EA|nr:glycosyltransferase [Vibrio sp. B1FLJ16]CAD7797729.1 hypothetical protein ACOMICROBIO_FLGHMIGD_00226 [Vibrio sp. B1FLJ16]CAE6880812.1 hypothetical protein ACOMICROBIO_FLGHMIGD_00226 [Vibrio sp. B1FLJ16]